MKRYEPMQNLKNKRIEKGFTQEELSDRTGIRQNLLSCYETGVYFPRRRVLEKLAAALGCEVKDII